VQQVVVLTAGAAVAAVVAVVPTAEGVAAVVPVSVVAVVPTVGGVAAVVPTAEGGAVVVRVLVGVERQVRCAVERVAVGGLILGAAVAVLLQLRDAGIQTPLRQARVWVWVRLRLRAFLMPQFGTHRVRIHPRLEMLLLLGKWRWVFVLSRYLAPVGNLGMRLALPFDCLRLPLRDREWGLLCDRPIPSLSLYVEE
jgi:hypothetical protein